MKKLFTICAMAAMATVGASAVETIYVIGVEGTWINNDRISKGWDLLAPIEVKAENGVFTLNCEECTEISIGDAKPAVENWNFWDAHRYGPTDPVKEANFGKPMPMSNYKGANFVAPWPGDWTLVISQDLQTITYSTTTPKPETHCYLYADQNWDAWCDEKWQFEKESDTVYWFDCMASNGTKVNATDNLNIMTGTNNNDYSSAWWASKVRPVNVNGTPQTWGWKQGGLSGKSLEAPYEGTVRVVLPAEVTENCTVEVTLFGKIVPHETAGIEGVVVEDDATPEYFNLQGIRVAAPEAGKLYIERRGGKVAKVLFK